MSQRENFPCGYESVYEPFGACMSPDAGASPILFFFFF